MYIWDVSLHRGIYFSLELGLKLAETSIVPLVVLVPEVSTRQINGTDVFALFATPSQRAGPYFTARYTGAVGIKWFFESHHKLTTSWLGTQDHYHWAMLLTHTHLNNKGKGYCSQILQLVIVLHPTELASDSNTAYDSNHMANSYKAWAHGRRAIALGLRRAKLTTIGNNNGSYRGIMVYHNNLL